MEQQPRKTENVLVLVKQLVAEFIKLIYQHYLLLKKELSENVAKFGKSIVLITASLIIGYVGLIFVGILAIYMLSQVIPSWIALLLVTFIYIGVPIFMFIYGVNTIKKNLKKPEKFMEEFRKTGEETEKWLKDMNTKK